VRLLFIAPEPKPATEIHDHSEVWSAGLAAAFVRLGIDVQISPPLENAGLSATTLCQFYAGVDWDNIDHVVALGGEWFRYFERIARPAVDVVVRRCRGVVAQIHAHGGNRPPPQGVTNLAVCDYNRANSPYSRFIGWGTSPELLYPDQNHDEIRVLVDHQDYAAGAASRRDRSGEIIRDCLDFARVWDCDFERLRFRQFVDGGFADLGADPVKYTRGRISYADCVAEYRKTHVFVVTHTEDTAQTCIEVAMCGALLLVPTQGAAPRPFLPADRLATVRHVIYSGHVPWSRVIDEIDVEASRAQAASNTWDTVAERVVSALRSLARESGKDVQ
jgi:hypothetical protein